MRKCLWLEKNGLYISYRWFHVPECKLQVGPNSNDWNEEKPMELMQQDMQL